MSSQQDNKGVLAFFMGFTVVAVLFNLAFWGSIAYIAHHFISKFW
jgi:hypothetical protein